MWKFGRAHLRVRLLLLSIVAVVPVVVFMLIGARSRMIEGRAAAEAALVVQARSLAQDIDRQASDLTSMVEMLSARFSAQGSDLAGLNDLLAAIAAVRPGVSIATRSHQVASVRFTSPFSAGDLAAAGLGIELPLVIQGRAPVAAEIRIDRSLLRRILAEHPEPDGWIAAIIDQSDRIVARNRRDDVFVGTVIIPPVRIALVDHISGLVRTVNVEGVTSSIAFARAPLTGFAVALAMPSALFERPLSAEMRLVIAFALMVSVAAALMALLLARQITEALRGVTRDILTGREPEIAFAEIVDLAKAFRATALQRDLVQSDLMRQEQNLRDVFDALPLGVAVVEEDGLLAFINARASENLRGEPAATPGEREQLFHPEDRAGLRAWWIGLGSGAAAPVLEARWQVHDQFRWHAVRSVALARLAHRPARRVVILLDIHDAYEARKALRQANVQLEERAAERARLLAETAAKLAGEVVQIEQIQAALLQSRKREALGRLTGGVAHEVNNVLAVIANSYATIELAASNPAVRESVAAGMAAVEHSAGLMRYLVAFARHDPIAASRVGLNEALSGIALLCRPVLGDAFVLALEIDRDLPHAFVDVQMLQAAVVNLVTNAREAMPLGGRVVISATLASGSMALDAGPEISISVMDTGIGMTPDQINRAAEPFYTTKGAHGGSGLGLSMVDGFVTQSRGRLVIESTPGGFTRVTMILPGLAYEAPAIAAPATAPELPASTAGRTILLVDDNLALLRSTALLLRTFGYTVLDRPDAQSALECAVAHPEIDLVLTDVTMPNGSGFELADRLALHSPSLAVVFVTGFSRNEHALRGRPLLQKPFTIEQMLEAVEAALGAGYR